MSVIFTELARLELEDAAELYELKAVGLGNRFKNEIKDAVSRIVLFPKAGQLRKGKFAGACSIDFLTRFSIQ